MSQRIRTQPGKHRTLYLEVTLSFWKTVSIKKKIFLSSLFWKSPLLNKPIIDTTHVSSKGSVIILEKSWNAGRPELI